MPNTKVVPKPKAGSVAGLSPAATRTLKQLKEQLSADQAKRDAIVDRGRRAYHLGIEDYNSPEQEPSARKLWLDGWKIAKEKFEAQFPSRVRQ